MSAAAIKTISRKTISRLIPKTEKPLSRLGEIFSGSRRKKLKGVAERLQKRQASKSPSARRKIEPFIKSLKTEGRKELAKEIGVVGGGSAALGGIGYGTHRALTKKSAFQTDDPFAYGFFDELEKIAVDWSVLAPALGGAALGGAAGGYTGYKATKAVGGGKKSRIAGAALGGLGGAALGGGVGHAGALAFQPEAAGEMGIKQVTAPFRAAGVVGKGVYRGGKGVVDYLKAVGRGAGKGMADIAPLRLGGRAARAAAGK